MWTLAAVVVAGAALADVPAGGRPAAAELRAWRDRFTCHLQDDLLGFWLRHGPDAQFGGFHGGLDRRGVPDPKARKSLVQQSRVLWTFSAAYRDFSDERYRDAARAQAEWFIKHFWDTRYAGWYWAVNRDGSPADTHKYSYGQSFAIYALAEYGIVCGDARARKLAFVSFRRLDQHGHDDAHGGYADAFTRDWSPEPKVDPIGPPAEKSTNTHLHLMESFSALHRVQTGPPLEARIEEVRRLFLEKIVDPQGFAHESFKPDWTPVKNESSYGHDIELAWLFQDATLVLGKAADDPDAVRLARSLADHALAYGYDWKRGGFFERGPAVGPATTRTKSWWEQAEGLVGLLATYQMTGDVKYWRAFAHLADWTLRVVADHEYGEWFPTIGEDGAVKEDWKASEWKGPYHQGRACLEMIRRLDDLVAAK